MGTAKYIINILKSNLNIVLSWGLHNLIAYENGVEFKVQGFKFKGWVSISYNQGSDLFDLTFENRKGVKMIEGVYVDSLISIIDNYVEYTGEKYKNDVEEWLRAI